MDSKNSSKNKSVKRTSKSDRSDSSDEEDIFADDGGSRMDMSKLKEEIYQYMEDDDLGFPICHMTIEQGSVLTGFIESCSVKNQTVLFLSENSIIAKNSSADDKIVKNDYLDGDEIQLEWSSLIPKEYRNLVISFNANELKKTVSKMLKKDHASLIITHRRTPENKAMFFESHCNPSVAITVLKTSVNRESSKEALADIMHEKPSPIIVADPEVEGSLKLRIIPRDYVSACKNYRKCSGNVYITFYDKGEHRGIFIYTDGSKTWDKLGYLPSHFKINELLAMKNNKETFGLSAKNIDSLIRMVFHTEGIVKIIYHPNHHLKISRKVGPIGEQTMYIFNEHVSQDGTNVVCIR